MNNPTQTEHNTNTEVLGRMKNEKDEKRELCRIYNKKWEIYADAVGYRREIKRKRGPGRR